MRRSAASQTPDRIIELLDRFPLPLRPADVAREIGCSRQNALQILAKLEQSARVVRMSREPDRRRRGPWLVFFALPGRTFNAALEQLLKGLQLSVAVVTPSGRSAAIERIDEEGFAELRYLDDPAGDLGTCHASLLRPMQPGRERPAPARFEAAASA